MAKSLSLITIIFVCYFLYVKAQLDDCDRKCGNINFSYPFTISGRNCKYGLPGFEINCSTIPTITYFDKYFEPNANVTLQIVDFSYKSISVVSNVSFALPCANSEIYFRFRRRSPFAISENNKFVTIGCNTKSKIALYGDNGGDYQPFTASWESRCWNRTFNLSSREPLPCKKNGCNYIPLPTGFYRFRLSAEFANTSIPKSCDVSGSAIVDQKSWESIQNSRTTNLADKMYPMSLVWAIPSRNNCSKMKTCSSYECAQKAVCEDQFFGYVCKCPEGYSGDGYQSGTGCTATCSIGNSSCAQNAHCEEKPDGYVCKCNNGYKGDGHSGCTATCSIGKTSSSYVCAPDAECDDGNLGFFVCKCPEGYKGDGYINGTGCTASDDHKFETLSVITGACGALVVALFAGGAMLWALKRRNSKLAKEKNFDRNGGAQLQSFLSSRGVEGTRLFTLDEMEKATNNFSQSLVLGTGGYGTVFKGTLKDGTIVAVKKSKEIDAKEIDQFINEVVILSQINHRNVVRLLGCCLETQVPLLIYEYIPNGTVFEHLHSEKYEHQHLVWEDRMRIATETAEALSYLHSAASMPVVHRDVKSSNILLDDAFTPKVADFGVSRLVPMGQTHVTTVVQGTLGYLDPEYFQTVQLTEKSDVYSFGVVLVELLTGLKPVSYERMKNQSNLAIFFLSTLKTNGLIGILDPRLNGEESRNMESMRRVANLAKECLSVEGEKRPTMKEVVQELLWTRNGSRNHAWLDVDGAQNEEEMICLIAEESERSDKTKGCGPPAEESYSSFSIERFREGIDGR